MPYYEEATIEYWLRGAEIEAEKDHRTFDADYAMSIIRRHCPARVRANGYTYWLPVSDSIDDPRMICANCRNEELPIMRWRFCPNCGLEVKEIK